MSRADQSHRRRKNPLAAVFRAVGIILLIAIIAICVPLIVPKTMGISALYCRQRQYGTGGSHRKPGIDRKSTRLNSSHRSLSRMPSSA